MSMLDTDETPVMFHDALSCFSDDDWKVLQEWQKELCGNVMKEIHQALNSLGPLITSTVFSLRAKGKQQVPSLESQESERRPLVNGFPCGPITNPDELFCNMKGEQNVHLNNPPETEERDRHECLSRDDPATIFINHLGADAEESSTAANSGVPLITAVFSLSTNPEEETCAQDTTEAEKRTTDSGSLSVKESSTCYESQKNFTCPSTGDQCQEVQIDKITIFTDVKNALKRNQNHLQLQKYHAGKKAFPCSFCWKSFTQKSVLQCHQRIHTGEKPYSCNECEKRFTQQAGLKRHQRFHSGVKPFPCTECEKSFVYKSDFQRHQRIHKREKTFHCPDCEKSFTHMSILQCHQRIHIDEESLSCTDCDKSFVHKSDFLHHQRMHTDAGSMFVKESSTCYESQKNFTCPSTVDQYQEVQIDTKPVFTDVKNALKRNQNHLQHQKYPAVKKAFPCSVCWKSFTKKSDLHRHHRIHTGEKPYSCSECNKRFSEQAGLKRHQRFHSGDKPFPCTECEKSFVCKSDLQRHQKIHKREKTVHCPEYEKSFTHIVNSSTSPKNPH